MASNDKKLSAVPRENSAEIIIYQTADDLAKIDVRMNGETLWLSQAQMPELFGRERSVITKHIRNVFSDGELDEKSNVQNLHIANSDKPVAFYNLLPLVEDIERRIKGKYDIKDE